MAWALRMPRTHAYISLISFGVLKLFQCMDQSISKDFNIGSVARHVLTVQPNNVGFQNGDCDLVSETRSFEFMGVKGFVGLPTGKLLPMTTEIDTIDGDEAVISDVAFFPVLPYDL
jgi:hypothetical protein